MRSSLLALSAASAFALTSAAHAQDAPRRTRIALGPQLVPSYPGSDEVSLRPFIDGSRVRGDTPFAFEAPDESFALPLINEGGFAAGPSIGFQGSRKRSDVGGLLPKVSSTFELGGFAQYQLSPSFRVRAEARRGLGGHDGWIADTGADYIARDGDRWLFSIGPRATFSNQTFQRAYFGVRPAAAAASGLPVFRPDGGLQSVGGTVGALYQLSERWGVQGYTRYDRLVSDAGDSPVVRRFGSRNQLSTGVALTYTFGG